MNQNSEVSGIGILYQDTRLLFSHPDNYQEAQQLPLEGINPIVEISVGYNDDNIE